MKFEHTVKMQLFFTSIEKWYALREMKAKFQPCIERMNLVELNLRTEFNLWAWRWIHHWNPCPLPLLPR